MHVTVYEHQIGLLYVDGRYRGEVSAGRHRVKSPFLARRREIVILRRGPQSLYLPPVDVVSQDRLLFRVQAQVTYKIVDPRAAHEREGAMRLTETATRALVGLAAERTLAALLDGREAADAALLQRLAAPIEGCQVTAAALLAIVLPPELRRLYAETERARLEGLAALERARGEQAALRALNNAARMLKGNPELMNLRLLQALQSGSGKSAPTLVLGAGTGVAPVSLDAAGPAEENG